MSICHEKTQSKMNRIIPVLVFALCLNACSADTHNATPFMTGGTYTNWGQFPSVVSIQSPYNIHCIGTIVHPLHILTSARCVLNEVYTTVNPSRITIVAGDIRLAPRSISRAVRHVTAIFVHDHFNTFTLFGDLAVLRLDAPFVFPHNTIQVATRSTRIVPVGTICHLAGWGTLGMDQTKRNQVGAIQTVIEQKILHPDSCNQADVHREGVLESMICAGSIFGGSVAPCHGNLGGGLYCNDLIGGVSQLAGILSFGINCGGTNDPPVYQQVRFFNNWIESQFTRTDIPGPQSFGSSNI